MTVCPGAGHNDLVTGTEHSWTTRLPRRLGRLRVGQLLGLLFLIGPLSDLLGGGLSPPAKAAILVCVAAFAALYLALLPPIGALAAGGLRVTGTAVGLLAGLAALTLVLGAPRSFLLLFVYVVAAAGVVLPAAAAVGVTVAVAASGVSAPGRHRRRRLDRRRVGADGARVGAVMMALGRCDAGESRSCAPACGTSVPGSPWRRSARASPATCTTCWGTPSR